MQPHEELDEAFEEYQKKMEQIKNSRKKNPDDKPATQQQKNVYVPEPKVVPRMKFQDLPEEIQFYLIEIYPFGGKLFITGLMENGQTLNVVANDLYRQIYFVLKDEGDGSGGMSSGYLQKAQKQIKAKLRGLGLRDNEYEGKMVERQYVFEIQEIPRDRRMYYQVRYSFKKELNEELQPNCEGDTYRYVIGLSYTPLELLIVNKGIKGPSWVVLKKQHLQENTRNTQTGLCVDIGFSELIEVSEGKKDPPTVRAMSFSIKAAIPATISTKKYFPTDRKDQTHIYAISYHICENYKVNIKDPKPNLKHRTYYVQTLGDHPNSNQFIKCTNEINMLARFEADIKKYDPDFLVCHDSSKILDTLICRLAKLGDKNTKTKFGRLNLFRDLSKSNQTQRINGFIAGRLLVDTFLHSKDMIKSIDYQLESMAKHIRPERNFVGISDEEAKVLLGQMKPLPIINKCKQQSEVTFSLMNHLQIVQMTRQLSNICGNLWKRSLQNKRAERNEFLIMHECKDRDLIIPDKFKRIQDEQVEIKKKYQGGMVLEPDQGYYSEYILLLDFNSLYPSIIREYNVCFSVIERPKVSLDFYYKPKGKNKNIKKQSMKDVGDQEQNPQELAMEEMFTNAKNCNNKDDWGFLPKLIDKIVERRKVCKKMMKKAKNPVDTIILDIQQKCYKLVANSIYGCLGFSVSRFYSRPLAALITKKGRDSLMAAKDIVSKRGGVRVIYGDTDSLMIQPSNLRGEDNPSEADKLKLLKKVADELKGEINKMYTFLQIDIDGIFKPLILLMKKKYVANKLINFDEIIADLQKQPKFSLEYKGIQIVRRDGCKIARDMQQKVIQILVRSDNSELDSRYQEIIDLFTTLKEEIDKKPKEDFLFSKQLSKKPKEYSNADHQPHVKVALDRLEAGEKEESLVNHTIYYIICKPKNQSDSLAKCAYDLKAFDRSRKFTPENPLQIDFDYYKSVIVEPVGRLLHHINSNLYDQLVEILDISKRRRKDLKKSMDEEIDQNQRFGETIGQNFTNKIKQFVKQLGTDTMLCPNKLCKKQCKIVDKERDHVILTRCEHCSCCITNIIYNKIRMRMKTDSTNYYKNSKRCGCGKTFELTPITYCCQIDRKHRQKGDIAFKLHNFLYLSRDLCEFSLSKLQKKYQDDAVGLQKIQRMIDNFLDEQSNYENISSIFNKLKI